MPTEQLLTSIEFETKDIGKSVKELKNVTDSLDAIWQTAEQANKGITDLISNISKLKGKTIGTQNNNSTVNQIYADKGMASFMLGGGSAVQLDPSNKQNQKYMEKVQNQILAQEQQYEDNLKQLNILQAKRIAKMQKELDNFDQILANQTKAANYKQSMAAYKDKRNTDDWVNASLRDMETRADYRVWRMQHAGDKKSSVATEERERTRNIKRTVKYQAGMGFIDAGSYLGKNLTPPISNTVSTITQFIGASLSNPAMGMAVAITQATKALTQFTASTVKAYSEIDSLKTQLSVVFGNSTQSDAMFSQIAEYATKSPFGVQQTTELATLLKQSGEEATNLMKTLKMLGDTAGGNMEKMKRVSNNYAQIVSIGKASMLDMRQFAYAGIPIFEEVAKNLNVSQSELRKLISDGKVTSEVIKEVFQDLTEDGGLFFNATAKGAETLKARFQNLKDIKNLALGAVGERIVRAGEQTGGDSLVIKGLSVAEDFYTKMSEKTGLKNIEKSVKTIEKNKSQQQEIKDLIDWYKKTNDISDKEAKKDPYLKSLYTKLQELTSYVDPDKNRNLLSTLYKTYNGASPSDKFLTKKSAQDYIDKSVSKKNQLINKKDLIERKYDILFNNLSLNENTLPTKEDIKKRNALTKEKEEELKPINIELNVIKETLREANKTIDYFETRDKTSPEMEAAYHETQIISGQQLSYDQAHEARGVSSSIDNVVAQIRTAREKSEEYQQDQLQKQKEQWEKTITLLEKINKAQDEKGVINLSKTNGATLIDLKNKGGLDARKLAVTYADDTEKAEADKAILESQFKQMAKEIQNNMAKNNMNAGDSPIAKALKYLDNTDTISFYSSFTEAYDSIRTYLEDKIANALNDKTKDFWNTQLETLELALNEWSAATDISKDDLKYLEDLKKKQFIPLWKRVLAQYTGVSATAITDTKATLQSYSDDLAVRNRAGNTIKAMLQSGASVSDVQRLLTPNGYKKTLQGTSNEVFQLDFKALDKALKEFTSNLKTSSNVIQAHKNGLETELETYQNLLSQGLIASESQDVKNIDSARYISVKKFDETIQDTGEQLVTAFGEYLMSDTGKIVGYNKETDKYTAENGTEYSKEQLWISDSILDYLKTKIPELQKELSSQNKTLRQRKYLEDSAAEVIGTQLLLEAYKGSASQKTLSYISENPENFISDIVDNIDFSNNSFSDIKDLYTASITKNDSRFKEAGEVLAKAFTETIEQENVFTNSSDYSSVNGKLLTKAKNESMVTAAGILMGSGIDDRVTEYHKKDRVFQRYETNVAEGAGIDSSLYTFAELGKLYVDKEKKAKEEENNRLEEEKLIALEKINKLDEEIKLKQNIAAMTLKDINSELNPQIKILEEQLKNILGVSWSLVNSSSANVNEAYERRNEEGGEERYQSALKARGDVQKLIFDNYGPEALELMKLLFDKQRERQSAISNANATYNTSSEERQREAQEKVVKAKEKEIEKNKKLIDDEQELGRLAVAREIAAISIQNAIDDLSDSVQDLAQEMGRSALTKTFESLGRALVEMNEESGYFETAWDNIKDSFKQLAGEWLSNMGTYMAQAGFQIAGAAAVSQQWDLVAAGLGLAAAGGFTSGIGSGILNSDKDDDKNKDDEKLDRLEKLRDSLLQILDQAKIDANYYETHLRHKNAISTTDSITNVNDMILTPHGNFSTAPDDYIIATKNPQNLGGGSFNMSYQPNITFKVVNPNGSPMQIQRTEQSQSSNGDLEIVAYLTNAFGEKIANGEMDNFFTAREVRLRGNSFSS